MTQNIVSLFRIGCYVSIPIGVSLTFNSNTLGSATLRFVAAVAAPVMLLLITRRVRISRTLLPIGLLLLLGALPCLFYASAFLLLAFPLCGYGYLEHSADLIPFVQCLFSR